MLSSRPPTAPLLLIGSKPCARLCWSLLRCIYGVSDKVLCVALADLLLGASQQRPVWREVGATLVAVDTLVHNLLHRTGILRRLGAQHPYGERCYRAGGCADILALLAANIDARQFNPTFPKSFPRFVQSAVWRYCAADGLDICNGNRIDDESRCDNRHCQFAAAIASLCAPSARKWRKFNDLKLLTAR
jgi:hypothetical protein